MADPEFGPPGALSGSARRRVSWQRVEDALGIFAQTRRGGAPTAEDEPISSEERERLRQAIRVVRDEFGTALSGLRRVTQVVTAAIVAALGLAVAGGALIQLTPYAGLLSVAGIGSLFALLAKTWRLARDQAMLQLIPARYSLAVEFCRTRNDAQELIRTFLAETTSLQSGGGDQSSA